jgi:hypothetical protein
LGTSGGQCTFLDWFEARLPYEPTFFGLFPDGLHKHLLHACPGVGTQLRNGTCVPDLSYADDFALLATTPDILQCIIDAAAALCAETGMIISVAKTKVVFLLSSFLLAYQGPSSGCVMLCIWSVYNSLDTLALFWTASRALSVPLASFTGTFGVLGRNLGSNMGSCSAACQLACSCACIMHVCRPLRRMAVRFEASTASLLVTAGAVGLLWPRLMLKY